MNLDTVKTWVIGRLPVLLIGALVGGGLVWFLKPGQVRVEEKLKVVEVIKEVVVVREVVRVEIVKVKDTQVVERWHREKTETKSPDGTVVLHEVEDRNIDTLVKERENTVQVKVVEVIKEVVVEREKIVTSKPVMPDWRIGVSVGLRPELLPVPKAGPVVIGIDAQRRLLGPVWLGIWGSTAVDLSGVQMGLKGSVEF